MGSRLNVRCVKTPSEERGTTPVLGKGTTFEDPLDSEEGRWSSAGPVNSAVVFFFFIVCFGVALAAKATDILLQGAVLLTQLEERYGNRVACAGESKENQAESLSLV